ncbi:hypothetical protein [Lacimicrobium alkaliphilum]|uniref:Uncharacterized protein n=1 Tax=Lacimicrobium alkaliphilum TaxID=1526571 RepID=A0A0U2RN31_9ALTE|nr:hypothetical protein [Lacimicrobium alkaliphilum]ALS98730.1 hypothetical protein AT746_10915 [Lacimicrobium alkaliphilum]
MEYLPKLFARKFEPHSNYVALKIIGFLLIVMALTAITKDFMPLLSSFIFHSGFAAGLVLVIGFQSVQQYRPKNKFQTSNPLLLCILASSLFESLVSVWSKVSSFIFLVAFHVFLVFAVFSLFFPFLGLVHGR